MIENIQTKSAVTVSEMARMVGLSRSRFYQLQGTAFPHPVYDPQTRRPFYTAEQQQVCLEVLRRNCGIDGKPILFYASGPKPAAVRRKNRKSKVKTEKATSRNSTVVEGVKSLGMNSVSARQVEQTIRKLFPDGTSNVEQGEVIRAVFVALMRQNSTDNLGG
ncbi:MAG: hypothetical protein HUJ26_04460 [Planctomycetaceae bacterium]|nr:hypothetical protein [Planctomycetaceae bacterium]